MGTAPQAELGGQNMLCAELDGALYMGVGNIQLQWVGWGGMYRGVHPEEPA